MYRKKALLTALILMVQLGLSAQQKFALVIGNADYQRIAKLRNTINDAQDIAASLRSLGFQVDLKLNVNRLQMIDAVDAFVNNLKRNKSNEGFFWYAGHAVQIREENYLLPIDVTAESENRVKGTSNPLNDIIRAIEEAKNKVNVVILDACRNNPLPASGRSGGSTRGISVIHDVSSDLFVMFSTQPGDIADDGAENKRNSPFAEAFLKYMKSTEPVYQMAIDVTNETLRLTNNRQEPYQHGRIRSEKYYSLNPAKTPAVAAPTAPRNVRAGTPGTDKVTLSWDSAGTGIRYKVYYNSANDPARASALGTLSDGTSTTMVVTGLSGGIDYYFWVTSVQNGVESAKSPVVSVKTAAVAPAVITPSLAAPRNVRAGTPGTDKVTLSWDSAGTGIRYKVYYNSANDPARASALGTLSDGTSMNVTGLSGGIDYYFWVTSVQNGVESAKSPVVTVKTAAAVKPVAPPPERPVPTDMVRIEGGTFMMGSPASEKDRQDREGPQHTVRVSSFYLGKYEVTQKEYRELMGSNPSSFRGDNMPVERVSWFDAVKYCNKRSEKEGLTPAYTISGSGNVDWNRSANGYRLPTEAEWEYACRAGTTTPFSTGNNITTNQANYDGYETTPVGRFAPNAWGLYDMHGNVSEWCWDWYGAYSSGSVTDPLGASSGSYRVRRGGSWGLNGQHLRSAYRGSDIPSYRYNYLGFRLLRP